MDSFTLNKVEFDAVRRIVADFCASSLGKGLAAHMGPSRNPQIVQQWLEQTTQMVSAVTQAGLPPFGGITDIAKSLAKAAPGGGASGEDFAAIASALEGAANVRAWMDALDEGLPALHELAAGIGNFQGEVRAIRSVVGPDGAVLDSASERLAELRRKIEQLSQRVRDVMYGYLRQPEVAGLLQNVNVTLAGDRYVLPVKSLNRGRLPGVVHRESNTGATVFVEPNESVELNNELSDLREDERSEIQRLLTELAVRVSGRAEAIAATMHALAQVDLLLAKAQYAIHFEMTCPQVSERGPLQLTQARHPLLVDRAWRQERAGVPVEQRHAVVPIDVRLGMDFDVLVVTGSNTGGKTVALKTVALMALMAQSGLHIPAQRGGMLPVFRDVFIDVGDEQSLEQSLSTFGAHIKRIRYILSKADAGSLILLDELGSGTDPDEGGAIGQAIIDELRQLSCLAMVTTHLSVLKAYAYSHPRVDNASVEFDTATLSPTYRLHIGTPGESHAITVAGRLGLPKRIVIAARGHLSEQSRQFNKAIQATTAARQSAEVARTDAQAARVAAQSQQELYEAKLADLHRIQDDFESWLASLPEMKEGDEVFVPSLNKTGRLVRLELHRQVALVTSGSIEVEVPLRELMPDLGQTAVREQIANLRDQILSQARQGEQARAEAVKAQEEYHRSLELQKMRARQFDSWLGAIGRLRVGAEVPIARKPGRGTVVSVDLPGLRAKVKTAEGEIVVALSDLFPQTGPFAPREPREQHEPRRHGPPQHRRPDQRPRQDQRHGQDQRPGQDRRQSHGHELIPDQKPQPAPDRPMPRRQPQSSAAKESSQAVIDTKPGQHVFVVPFNKRATLIRMDREKGIAVVQAGAFEMEIPLADIEPVRAEEKPGGNQHEKPDGA